MPLSFRVSPVLVLVATLVLTSPVAAAIPTTEREALVALYVSTNGDAWVNNSGWNGAVGTECTWFGITCFADNVTGIDLSYNELAGSIPPDLAKLTSLTDLNFWWNQLSGTIPPELGTLPQLRYLGLGYNELTGSIPPQLGNLANLLMLDLCENHLSGSIPPELGNLAQLSFLRLSTNELTGTIPLELMRLSNLTQFYVILNHLTGPIPPELGDLTRLGALGLAANEFTGPIPPELGKLTNLTMAWMGTNNLTGSIPVEFARLPWRALYLNDTQISGPIPKEFGNAPLNVLVLRGNQLSGPIPPELGNLTDLYQLDLENNQLSGVVPRELGNLAQLRELKLSNNQLSGTIPGVLRDLTSLEVLDLADNQLTGAIPPELGGMVALKDLRLSDNQLSGAIPSELANLSLATLVDLSRNHLSGPIPAALAGMSSLNQLFLAGNELRGPIPIELTGLPASCWVDLAFNALYPADPVTAAWADERASMAAQTIAPTDFHVVDATTTSVTLGWSPILYDWDEGHYEVWIDAGSGMTHAGSTSSKLDQSLTIPGLIPGKRYLFTVRTVSDIQFYNPNVVESDFTAALPATVEVSAAVAAAPVPEGSGTGALLTVTLSPVSESTVVLDWATQSDSALVGVDLAPASGSLMFLPGETTKTIQVTVLDDSLDEPDEEFAVDLVSRANAQPEESRIAIADDDDPPSVSIGDTRANEKDTGPSPAFFPVTLSAPSGWPVTVRWETEPGTAGATTDYVSDADTIEFQPGETSGKITVRIVGETRDDDGEVFFVNLTNAHHAVIADGLGECTIIDDDLPPRVPDPVIRVTGCTEVGSPCDLEAMSGTQWDQNDWTYLWSIDGVGQSTSQLWKPSLADAGTYAVRLVATNAVGSGQASATLMITETGERCPEGRLCMLSKRFTLALSARDHRTDRTVSGFPLQRNDIFGFFSLPELTGSAANPEVFVKVIDGRPVNGNFWNFYGGLTDLEYTLTVTDTITGESRSYVKPAGSTAGGFDTGGGVTPETCTGEVDGNEIAPTIPRVCAGGVDGLCLEGARFLVNVLARDPRSGREATGVAIPENEVFGFFALPALTDNGANPEVFVKVIDGRGVNGHYWFFYGGLTDLDYTVTVTDTTTGVRRTYMKAAGSACGAFDTDTW